MRNKKLIIAFCLLVLFGAGLRLRSQQEFPAQSIKQQTTVPEHVLYRMLFHDVYLRKQEALKAEQDGHPEKASAWRDTYRREAALSADEAVSLEQVAEQCEQEVEAQDAKARVIIDRDKARYPGGKLSAGQTIQPPSPELETLQAERNTIILRSRDRLHEIFGEREVRRFQDFLKQKLAPQITATSGNQ